MMGTMMLLTATDDDDDDYNDGGENEEGAESFGGNDEIQNMTSQKFVQFNNIRNIRQQILNW